MASADLEPWLGEEVASAVNPPKASSVALLSRGSPDGQPPKFSKYSGVAEMEDAIAVFVNLTKGSGDVYDNTFSMGGRRGPPMGGREKRGAWKARLLGRRKGISTRLRGQGRLAGTLEGQ